MLSGLHAYASHAGPFPTALVVANAGKYLDVREKTNHNDHPQIDRWLAYAGVPKGNPYCAAFVVYNYGEVAEALGYKNPLPRYARVSLLYQYALAHETKYRVCDSDDILSGLCRPQAGDVAVWLYGKGPNPNGHAGLVRSGARTVAGTREANTGPGKGVVREGNGVYDRERQTSGMAAIVRVK